jgi:mRNA-degrading endonuclease toxin of MazEF toxin-antitoxin module
VTKHEREVPNRGDVIDLEDEEATYSSARSLLVLSPAEYNRRTGTLIGLAVSSNEVHATNPFAIVLPARKGKSTQNRYVLANAVRTEKLVGKGVLVTAIDAAPEGILSQACETLNQIVEIGR